MPDIAPCILCDSEAESTADEARKVVTWDCPKCRQYTLVADVAAELRKLPNWQELRPKLAKAVPWRFYYQGPGLVVLWNIMDAERLVLYHKQFEEEFAQGHAVAALVRTSPRIHWTPSI